VDGGGGERFTYYCYVCGIASHRVQRYHDKSTAGTDLSMGLVSFMMTYDGNPLSSFSTAAKMPPRACGLMLSTGFVFGRFAVDDAYVRRAACRKPTTKQLPMAFIFFRRLAGRLGVNRRNIDGERETNRASNETTTTRTFSNPPRQLLRP